jgi:hypothetical protein
MALIFDITTTDGHYVLEVDAGELTITEAAPGMRSVTFTPQQLLNSSNAFAVMFP